MGAIVPRFQLPDSWSGKAACPVCRTAGSVRVVHEAVLPDRMQCSVCGAAFELESGGAHLRLLALPEALAYCAPDFLNTWLMPNEVPSIGRPVTGVLRPPFAQDSLPPAPSAADVATFADDLLPPAPLPETGALRRKTGPLPPQGVRKATGTLPGSYGTAPLTTPAGAKRTTMAPPPPPAVRPTSPPPAQQQTMPPAETGPALDLHALNEELDGVLKAMPERTARSDEALADELGRLLAEIPAVTPEPATEASAGVPATTDLPGEAILTQPPAREPFAEAFVPRELLPDEQYLDADPDDVDGLPPVVDSLRVARFTEQGDKLRQFGNSIDVIRATLERSGASPDEIEAALSIVTRAEAERLQRFKQTMQWVGGVAVVILLVLVAIALVISRPAPAPAPAPMGAAMLSLASIHFVNFTAIS